MGLRPNAAVTSFPCLAYAFAHGKPYSVYIRKRNNLFFYRDAKGNEVDLIYRTALDNFPFEIKSAQTLNNDLFRGLHKYGSVFDRSKKSLSGCLLYSGTMNIVKNNIQVSPFDKYSSVLQRIDSQN
ncbi:MAG TPA: hypothetical protein VKS21_01120 [Spirochaetota bacterium]|nr:hypothetical protein [Spirochaetota bacterium]